MSDLVNFVEAATSVVPRPEDYFDFQRLNIFTRAFLAAGGVIAEALVIKTDQVKTEFDLIAEEFHRV